MRIPVVNQDGTPLMPCTPAKARHLLKAGKAVARWNKLGIFYLQLKYSLVPDNQLLVVGIDPGSKFEGFSVVGTEHTVINLMSEAPTHVKDAVQTRREMRRARRHRKCWRRKCKFNRNRNQSRIPPSTRSRWEAKARIVKHLTTILPLTQAAVEDVKAETWKGKGRRWNLNFSPLEVGKQHFYRLLNEMGLEVRLSEGWQTKELRAQYGLKKTSAKDKQTFNSHAVDAWVLAADVTGAGKPDCVRLQYLVPVQLHRRQLHRLKPSPGGKRKPYGGTRSCGVKRGTLVKHPKYGFCTVGGVDRLKGTISLHDYRTNRRLTQGGKVAHCLILTWLAFRSWLVSLDPNSKTTKRSGVSSQS